MPTLPTKTVTGSQLISGLVGTVDIGSMIQKVIEIQREIDNTEALLKSINAFVESLPTGVFRTWQDIASKDFDFTKDSVRDLLITNLKMNAGLTRDQLMQSALGYGASASMIGFKNKLLATFYDVGTLTDMLIGIPQTIAYRRAERYWNKQLAPEYPNDRDLFMLYRLGIRVKADYINKLREIDGISAKDAENIAEMREWQIGQPNLRDAFLWYKMGYKSLTWFKELAKKGFGFKEEDIVALMDTLDYNPSIGELLRLSDLIPLDPKWVESNLDELGVPEEDKQVYKDAIQKRVIRDEVNKAWSIILDNYAWGLHNETEIRSLLKDWKFSDTEINLRVQIGELTKLKLRVKLLRDAQVYLYRNGVIDEGELMVRLVNIGLSKDIANAIVRYEAAKKGIDFEVTLEQTSEIGAATETEVS
jgi:hypothetical protein